LCRFSETELSACGCDRRPKSAKARNRGEWGTRRCGTGGLFHSTIAFRLASVVFLVTAEMSTMPTTTTRWRRDVAGPSEAFKARHAGRKLAALAAGRFAPWQDAAARRGLPPTFERGLPAAMT
jgi:hypothetical protein